MRMKYVYEYVQIDRGAKNDFNVELIAINCRSNMIFLTPESDDEPDDQT